MPENKKCSLNYLKKLENKEERNNCMHIALDFNKLEYGKPIRRRLRRGSPREKGPSFMSIEAFSPVLICLVEEKLSQHILIGGDFSVHAVNKGE